MVEIAPFKCSYPISLTDFALPMILSDIEISSDVKSLDEEELLKIPANIKTSDYKRIFEEILTLGHARKYESLNRYWSYYETLGFFKEETEDLLYVYRMEYTINNVKHQQTGLLCCLKLDKKAILGHENTIKEKLEDQLKRLEKSRTSISPVFLLYDDCKDSKSKSYNPDSSNDVVNDILDKITYSFPIIDLISSNDVRHTIWKIIDNKVTKQIINEFKKKEKVYIADGHHRIESSIHLRNKLRNENPNHTGKELYNYILTAIFPISQATMLEYNRVLKNVKKFKKEILPQLSLKFHVEEVQSFEKPSRNGTFAIYCKRRFYKLKLKEEIIQNNRDDIVKQLDSFIIQEYIFKDIFGIKNPRNSNKIVYVPGTWSIYQIMDVAESENGAAFILPSMSLEDMVKIADQSKIVPPKTTWFEPKLLKGMMFWKF